VFVDFAYYLLYVLLLSLLMVCSCGVICLLVLLALWFQMCSVMLFSLLCMELLTLVPELRDDWSLLVLFGMGCLLTWLCGLASVYNANEEKFLNITALFLNPSLFL